MAKLQGKYKTTNSSTTASLSTSVTVSCPQQYTDKMNSCRCVIHCVTALNGSMGHFSYAVFRLTVTKRTVLTAFTFC